MSYEYVDEDGDILAIGPNDGHGALVRAFDGAIIPRSEAPAAALAILEAAGINQGECEDKWLAEGVNALRRYITIAAEAKARAEDDARLDQEALELFNAARAAMQKNLKPVPNWDEYPNARRDYRAATLRARELYGAGK